MKRQTTMVPRDGIRPGDSSRDGRRRRSLAEEGGDVTGAASEAAAEPLREDGVFMMCVCVLRRGGCEQ